MFIVFWGVGANRGSSNGPERFCGNESSTKGGYVQRTDLPGLDEATTDP